jgi:hypothetical protein
MFCKIELVSLSSSKWCDGVQAFILSPRPRMWAGVLVDQWCFNLHSHSLRCR